MCEYQFCKLLTKIRKNFRKSLRKIFVHVKRAEEFEQEFYWKKNECLCYTCGYKWSTTFFSAGKIHQKQPRKQLLEVFCKKGLPVKISQISKENTVLESLFNKVAGPQDCNLIQERLQHSCFAVKYAKFLRTHSLKNIREQWFLQPF